MAMVALSVTTSPLEFISGFGVPGMSPCFIAARSIIVGASDEAACARAPDTANWISGVAARPAANAAASVKLIDVLLPRIGILLDELSLPRKPASPATIFCGIVSETRYAAGVIGASAGASSRGALRSGSVH